MQLNLLQKSWWVSFLKLYTDHQFNARNYNFCFWFMIACFDQCENQNDNSNDYLFRECMETQVLYAIESTAQMEEAKALITPLFAVDQLEALYCKLSLAQASKAKASKAQKKRKTMPEHIIIIIFLEKPLKCCQPSAVTQYCTLMHLG